MRQKQAGHSVLRESRLKQPAVVKYSLVNDASFSLCAVRIPLIPVFASATVPHLRNAFATSLPPLALSLLFTSGTYPQFSALTKSAISQKPSFASYGQPSHLTPLADSAVTLHAHSQLLSQFNLQSSCGFTASTNIVFCYRQLSPRFLLNLYKP